MATATKWFWEQPAWQEAGAQSFPITSNRLQAAALSASTAPAAALLGMGPGASLASRSHAGTRASASSARKPSPSEAPATAFPVQRCYASATFPGPLAVPQDL